MAWDYESARCWPVADPTSTVSLNTDGDTVRTVQFSADSRWIIAETAESYSPDAIRVWPVDGNAEAWVIRDAELIGIYGGMHLHVKRWARERGRIEEIYHVSGAREPLFVPANATVIRDEKVVYVEDGAVHIVTIGGEEEPLVLSVGNDNVVGRSLVLDDRVLAPTQKGAICLWYTEWPALTSMVRAASTACLKPEQRRRLLGESVEDAQSRWQSCEGRHGRASEAEV